MADPRLLVAATTAMIREGNRRYRIIEGKTVVRADDPVIKGRERLFRPLHVMSLGAGPDAPVEQATAAPGEKRDVPVAPRPAEPDVDLAAVRAWAKDQGIEVSDRGRVAADVIEQYKAAME